jgi:iron-sulfur cluster repair protein YtfE (RIC family)
MSEATESLREYFTLDHRRCDHVWAEVEAAAEAGADEDISTVWQRFAGELRRHLRMEEEILFPAFEQATGMTGGGPTFVMRAEHDQMGGLLEQMDAAVVAGDDEELLDQGDTLLLLIQQHNQKEEQMLYPMSEEALAADWGELRDRLEAFRLTAQ